MYIKFGILWKKRGPSEVISFLTYRPEKVGLLKCTESLVSEHLWTVNMLKSLKDRLNLHCYIFVIFFAHSEKKSAQKSLF